MIPLRSRRARLLLGAAALAAAPAVSPGAARAAPPAPSQLLRPATPLPPATVPGADGLADDEIYIEGDRLIDDRDHNLVTAEGRVEARVQGRTVRADKIVYNQGTGAAHAIGHAVIVNSDGTVQFGDDVQLDDQLRAGVALGFSARLQKNTTIAAGAAIKRSANVNELRNAEYTPCDICKADGVTPKTPTFDIRATRIIEDKPRKLIYYENAIIRVKGIPIFFFPVLFTPDPTADRRSGLLAPRVSYNKRLGLAYDQPYYFALSDSNDLTARLQLSTKVNPLLELQYRQRLDNGYLDLRGGYTHETLFDNNGRYGGDDTNRSYILGYGRFAFGPDWDAGFGLERVTDPTLFARYDVRSVFTNRGLYPADTDRLVTQGYAERTDPTSYISVAALSFQSLRAYGVDASGRTTFESNKAFPIVGPLIEARWDPMTDILGGRLRFRGSAVVLTRNDDVVSISDPTGLQPLGPQRLSGQLDSVLPDGGSALTYGDSRRASVRGEWRRDLFLPDGIRVQPLLEARGDLYNIPDGTLTVSNGVVNTVKASNAINGLAQGTAGFTASWPLIRDTGRTSIILEPIIQALVSPNGKPDRNIPNEDSVAFEFDDTTLFEPDRFPGFDLYESGARFNIGARSSFVWDTHTASVTVGRTYRTEADPAFTVGSGLQGRTSDYVAFAQVSPFAGTNFFIRSRLDAETLAVRRNEAGLDVGWKSITGSLRYQYNESGFFIDPQGVTQIGRVEDATVAGTWFFLKNWGVSLNATRDLRLKTTPSAQIGFIYRDECVRVDVVYTRDETYRAAIGASNSIGIRLTLATLGDTGSPFRPATSGR